MGEVVDLPGHSKILDENDHEFISDLARFADNLLSEAAVKKKYRLAESAWEALGSNDALVEKIEAEKLRRIRDGSTKRERAQVLVTQAPDVLGEILLDKGASPKHRIDSAKALDAFAANGPAGVPASDRFQITINLGTDHVLHFDKSISIDPDPHHIDDAPQEEWLPVIAASKPTEGNGGEPL